MYTIRKANMSYGGPPLLDDAQFTIKKEERIALIGRNGEGKSTLMKIVAGIIEPDSAEIEKQPSLKVAYLKQEVPGDLSGSVYEVILEGMGQVAELERAYHEASEKLESANDSESGAILDRMSKIQTELENHGAWDLSRKVERLLETLKVNGSLKFETLSGGLKRRVILGRELIKEPDLLLLDEPTNHLDFESIQWLESFLISLNIGLLFVTHDREFLKNIATRILELDRGKLTSFDCNYETYLERKTELLEAESTNNAVFDKKLAQEEAWIRQGIKARRTRNEGRVRALKKLRQERMERRDLKQGASFSLEQAGISGRKVIEVDSISYRWGEQIIVENFSTTIWRGDKIGIIGPNGSGKTTFLQLLLGQLHPQSGSVHHGTQLQTLYFDQHREELDPNASLREIVAGEEEFITVGSQKRHIYSYLGDFLFSSDQAKGRVSALSGGEKNRLLLARLFAKTANVLVMDEPTNDLDLETLELLEELLFDYTGTLLLVSHDRQFLNRVVTQTIAIEGQGKIKETVGGYDDYLKERLATSLPTEKTFPKNKLSSPKKEKIRYRTNKEHWELEEIPDLISAMESENEAAAQQLSDPTIVSDPTRLKSIQDRMGILDAEIEALMLRWEALEQIPVNPNKAIPENPNRKTS